MAITKRDSGKLSEIFATKRDIERFVTKDEFNTFKNGNVTTLDKIMKKLEDMYIELKMFNNSFRRHDEKLEAHETRIKALEVKV